MSSAEGTWHIHVRCVESGRDVSSSQSMRIGRRLWPTGSGSCACLHGAASIVCQRSTGVLTAETAGFGMDVALGDIEGELDKTDEGLATTGGIETATRKVSI
jgi:hypothetical protein